MSPKNPIVIAALLGLAACAAAPPAEDDGPVGLERAEAGIPFINQRSAVRTWQADGQLGLWIEDMRGQWYYAKFHSPCEGIGVAVRLGFQASTLNTLDRTGSVIVPGRARCDIQSLVKSDPPEDNGKRRTEVEE